MLETAELCTAMNIEDNVATAIISSTSILVSLYREREKTMKMKKREAISNAKQRQEAPIEYHH